jgi:hypothetical protein
MTRSSVLVMSMIFAAGCCFSDGALRDGRYESKSVSYGIGEPGEGWQRLAINQANLAWHNPKMDASLLVNSHCEGVADSPLESLTNDLLMGTTDREIVEQGRLPWSRREALETRARAKLDGVPREMMLFVLKKDGCVYDIVLDASAAHFEGARASYVRVRDRFDVEPRKDRS